jgi:alkanesulfonate monooxygenase SsuD/methylene tetrahydromethanopterin reductase-like flavin-dependent oxidoreductase (luciferase family)
MSYPRLGVSLPAFGPHVGPDAVATIANAAERLGWYSVSAAERLLLPAIHGWVNNFGLPDWPVYDPIETLTWAAAHANRIRLATSIINPLFQSPVVLARRLATLDQLSKGRLDVGLGQGWLEEEFDATGVPMSRRGAGFEDHILAMRACWSPDPVAHDGVYFPIALSKIGPKPFNGSLPLMIGAHAPVAIERAARLEAGLVCAFWSWDSTREEIACYRRAGGPGPIVLRVFPQAGRGDDPPGEVSAIAESILEILATASTEGVDEVQIELNIGEMEPLRQVQVLESVSQKILLVPNREFRQGDHP